MRSSLFAWVVIRPRYRPPWVGCQPEKKFSGESIRFFIGDSRGRGPCNATNPIDALSRFQISYSDHQVNDYSWAEVRVSPDTWLSLRSNAKPLRRGYIKSVIVRRRFRWHAHLDRENSH